MLHTPKEISSILKALEEAGFEAFLVGGCVRDSLLARTVGDWDITTNAKPDDIQKLFPDSFYANEFGTVGVKAEIGVVEVTTYRREEAYTDKRHPDRISFTSSLEEDLARRDFTMNAIAMSRTGALTDPFGGAADIQAKLVRAVGDAKIRFGEDALRLMRAVRFAAQLDFNIEEGTRAAIAESAGLLQAISKERARDELVKIIGSENAEQGIRLLQELGLLSRVIPELEEGIGVQQNKHHIYTVFEHNVRSLGFAARFGYNLETRLAALFHDIAKPHTKRGEFPDATFYGHEMVGAKLTAEILERLKFPKRLAEKIVSLVRWHLFYYNVDEVGEASVRRLVRKVGVENIKDLINLRIAERKGSGVPKAKPYKLRHLEFMIEKVLRQPLSVGQLAVDGKDVMDTLAIEPGPRVGYILNALLNEVLDDPGRNKKELLLVRARELKLLSESELKELGEAGEEKLSEEETKAVEEIKKKHFVK